GLRRPSPGRGLGGGGRGLLLGRRRTPPRGRGGAPGGGRGAGPPRPRGDLLPAVRPALPRLAARDGGPLPGPAPHAPAREGGPSARPRRSRVSVGESPRLRVAVQARGPAAARRVAA